jgi:hypothetical protein
MLRSSADATTTVSNMSPGPNDKAKPKRTPRAGTVAVFDGKAKRKAAKKAPPTPPPKPKPTHTIYVKFVEDTEAGDIPLVRTVCDIQVKGEAKPRRVSADAKGEIRIPGFKEKQDFDVTIVSIPD